MNAKKSLWYPLVVFLTSVSILLGQDVNTVTQPAPTPEVVNSLSIAIMDFDSTAPGNPELGSQLGDILTARLSIYDSFQLVERKKLNDLIHEQKLALTGLTDTSQTTQVGKLLSAQILIFGKAFVVDRDLYIATKIVGTETSRVKGLIAKGKLESNLSDTIDQLVDKLVNGLQTWAPELLPKTEQFVDRVALLKEQLKDAKLPTVGFMVTEHHKRRPIPDPAAQTEMKKVFKDVGFKIIEVDRQTLDQWSKDFSTVGVDLLITGEGISEFGTPIGGLVSCTARLEVQATVKETHEILTTERTTHRAVDLSEGIAVKTALQGAGRKLAIEIIAKITQELESQILTERKS